MKGLGLNRKMESVISGNFWLWPGRVDKGCVKGKKVRKDGLQKMGTE